MYGATGGIPKYLKDSVSVCERIFIDTILPVPGVRLLPGRLSTKKKSIGMYEVVPSAACFCRGLLDLPEAVPRRKSRLVTISVETKKILNK